MKKILGQRGIFVKILTHTGELSPLPGEYICFHTVLVYTAKIEFSLGKMVDDAFNLPIVTSSK